ncbi:hypothetical protein GCM10007860_31070 [Chitiniphilus shinanonensis]|uniref:DUF2271 domain-containing protein n=1 Tax=Chitiniphilus shinanonensis TaxID=553088 RepID=A0ABQ6C178_9NEIS|nr:DUF2271 domain-containing protein [Chitiniphilus shinanonensis]GLS05943.1 hypothetical protein GCM10007860_31070 [Chitiniphilus shinanonensis]
MRNWIHVASVPALLGGAVGSQAMAADLAVKLEIPRLNVAEYHRPYVAVWLERADQSVAANLAVWYDQKSKGAEGAGSKWLKDLRQWWRKSGRELQMPLDGVSGATRPAGEHQLGFSDGKAPLGRLAPGDYTLMIEAAREVGGRELVKVPLTWPPKAAQTLKAAGQHELGAISVELKP